MARPTISIKTLLDNAGLSKGVDDAGGILGGIGTVIGSTLAAILIRTIGAGLVFVDISPFWLKAIVGVLILVTVITDVVRRRRQERM